LNIRIGKDLAIFARAVDRDHHFANGSLDCSRVRDVLAVSTISDSAGQADPATQARQSSLTQRSQGRDRPGLEGGLWEPELGSIAYAYPSYEGNGPKTDVPQ
jgi:hypothetical protein